MYQRESIGLQEARKATDAIVKQVTESRGLPVCVAVVDDRGDLVHLVRMDGASLNSMHMAIRKAYTAARIRRNTSELLEHAQKLGGGLSAFDKTFTVVAGGVWIPLKSGEGIGLRPVLGGIGVGGCPAGDEDEKLANIGLGVLPG
jgi:uncharacterized protein GlcG (DUF336 family)